MERSKTAVQGVEQDLLFRQVEESVDRQVKAATDFAKFMESSGAIRLRYGSSVWLDLSSRDLNVKDLEDLLQSFQDDDNLRIHMMDGDGLFGVRFESAM